MIDVSKYTHILSATVCEDYKDTIDITADKNHASEAIQKEMSQMAEDTQHQIHFSYSKGSMTISPDGYHARKRAERIAADPSLDEKGHYIYGSVETFKHIQGHCNDDRDYVVKGSSFNHSEDRLFFRLCLDYFHPSSPIAKTQQALDLAIEALPEKQWRQGASSHQLAIWPDQPNPKWHFGDAYMGKDSIEVGNFNHGCYTWFCLMAHAYVVNAKKERQ